ncbi:MAG TPA: hydrogenase expression/formation protein HypE [bacterium]|nr:hydrogenase expression/formation protein HypE [bacterium]
MTETEWKGPACPVPLSRYPRIVMAHGSGGRLTRDLIGRMFRPVLANPLLNQAHDGTVLDDPGGRIVMTTDSHVIRPLFFPGGDIGRLSVFGTVNDLAMCGAAPRWLSLSLILEEGLDMETLWRVIRSIGEAARETGVTVVTGDTKVIDRRGGGELLINTTGIGVLEREPAPAPARIRPGDRIILSGDIGRHGIAVMCAREGLALEGGIESDCAPLHEIVGKLLAVGIPVHCLRDPTRGGLATALVELAADSGTCFRIAEEAVPVHGAVQGACELLGLDPLYVANEGRFVMFVPEESAETALTVLRKDPSGERACIIGRVESGDPGRVVADNAFGGTRILDLLTGDPLPRIC